MRFKAWGCSSTVVPQQLFLNNGASFRTSRTTCKETTFRASSYRTVVRNKNGCSVEIQNGYKNICSCCNWAKRSSSGDAQPISRMSARWFRISSKVRFFLQGCNFECLSFEGRQPWLHEWKETWRFAGKMQPSEQFKQWERRDAPEILVDFCNLQK